MPLFDTLLLQSLQHKDEKTIHILSNYLARIISQSAQEDLPALSHSLQQVIGPAISKEIASNKDAMIDTLYPIMGGMISKYVTQAIKEMMQHINHKIEEGLSFEKYKRKIKSKVTGVSEIELLLEESQQAQLSSLFIIDKESSLLVSEAHLEDKEIDDPHMVASMASAIKDFINDWVQNDNQSQKIQILSYGNATLYIEEAGSVYMIAFLDTEPHYEMRNQLNRFFASLITQYATFFQNFEGDDSAKEIKSLTSELQAYLTKQYKKTKSSPPKNQAKRTPYSLILLSGLLILGVGYYAESYYLDYSLEQKVKRQTGSSIEVTSQNNEILLQGDIASFKESQAIIDILKRQTNLPIQNHLQLSVTQIDNLQMHNRKQIEEKLKHLQQKLQTDVTSMKELMRVQKELMHVQKKQMNVQKEQMNVQKKQINVQGKQLQQLSMLLKEKNHTLQKIQTKQEVLTSNIHLQSYILKKLSHTFSHLPYYNPKDGSLDFHSGELFEAGESIANQKVLVQLGTYCKHYFIALLSDKRIEPYIESIIIEGHTDSSGNSEKNEQLSAQRATAVSEYLLTLDKSKALHLNTVLIAKGLSSSQPILKDGIEDKKASRRIKIRFILNYAKIIETIGKTIDD